MTIHGIIPALLIGKPEGLARTLDKVAGWNEQTAKKEVAMITKRYESIAKEKISSYVGLQICSEISSVLRISSTNPLQFNHALREISNLALYYHNKQFENDDKDKHLGLSPQSGDIQGTEGEVLQTNR